MSRIRLILLLLPLLAVLSAGQVAAQTGTGPSITAPGNGEALQGTVTISGSSDASDFQSAEITFAYADDPTGTWFLIASSNQPITAGMLASWDTTVITDGNYNLRLRVYLTDGSFLDSLVTGLRVRNYTPVETPTPLPAVPQATLTPTITLTATPYPTPTVLPPNPAALGPSDVSRSILYGGAAAICLYLIIGIYTWFRRR